MNNIIDIINAILVKNEGDIIFSGSRDFSIKLWSIKKLECIHKFLKAHKSTIAFQTTSLESLTQLIQPMNNELISIGNDSRIKFWNLETKKISKEVRVIESGGINSMDISSEMKSLLIGNANGTIKLI